MNLADGKLCLDQNEMRRVVAHGLNAIFMGTVDVKLIHVSGGALRPFEIVFGEPVPTKKDVKK